MCRCRYSAVLLRSVMPETFSNEMRSALHRAIDDACDHMAAALEAQRRETAEAREETTALRLQLAAATVECDEVRASLAFSESTATVLRQRVEELGAQADEWRDRANSLYSELDDWKESCARNEEIIAHQQQALAAQAKRNRGLRSELLELYADLRAEDLPSLITRIGMNLSQSEAGLFIDSTGESALSIIGLEKAPPQVRDNIFGHARHVLASGEPVVINDAEALPDGAGLVNLAALPVAVQGDTRGVILVANKRSAPYDDEDTELLLSIGHHAGVALENRRLHCELGEAYVSTVAVLADAIEAKDPYTRGHCESVSQLAVEVGRRLGWGEAELDTIRYAALLHDVGKIGVPDGILLKPGRLLPEEFSIIQKHAAIGSDLIKRVPALSHIAPVVLHHHERMDGAGYPDGQSGEEIVIAARIIGIVDSYDAMTSTRPYREPLCSADALSELQRCAGTQFDAELVHIVAEILNERSTEKETATNESMDKTGG